MPRIDIDLSERVRVPVLDVRTAMMIPTVSAMLADGMVDDEEISQILAICMQSPIYLDSSSDEDLETVLLAVRLVINHGDREMCQRACERLSPALRETAFAFAVAIVCSDRLIEQKEEMLIERLVTWLALDSGRAKSIVSVVPILQRAVDA